MSAVRRLAAGALALVLAFGPAAPLVLVATAPAVAVQPDEVMTDPVLEARARALSESLRCMVCQNQSIDDSDAPLARDLRLIVRERLAAGDSDAAVIDFLVARYGEFVLLEPRFGLHTLILWLAAPVLLVAGGLLAWRVVARRSRAAPAPLTEEEERAIAAVVDETKG